jgi:hypothetical protein
MKIFVGLLLIMVASAQYNETMGKYMAQLAVCSYCRPSQIESWECLPCKKTLKISFPSVLRNSTGDTLGYIAVSNDLDAVGIYCFI